MDRCLLEFVAERLAQLGQETVPITDADLAPRFRRAPANGAHRPVTENDALFAEVNGLEVRAADMPPDLPPAVAQRTGKRRREFGLQREVAVLDLPDPLLRCIRKRELPGPDVDLNGRCGGVRRFFLAARADEQDQSQGCEAHERSIAVRYEL